MKKTIEFYGLVGFFKLIMNLMLSKLIVANSRLIRRPVYIRGKNKIKFGKGLTTGIGLRLDADSKSNRRCIEIGDNVQMNDYVHIAAIESIKIGNNVLIASKVFITDHNHGSYNGAENSDPLVNPYDRKLYSSPVEIRDRVWIGEFVSVLPGVIIGEGSIIGTMSVVTKNVPSYSIAVGSPAKVIKKYNFKEKKWQKI
jgi:acetyltransferase-like isoleucine patch superfamily enzyme